MSEQPAKVDLRKQMPRVSDMVNRRRVEWGASYVNDCVRRGLGGEANCFYASEAGLSIGTAFSGPIGEEVAWYLTTHGAEAICFFKQPAEVPNGAH
jgi:hypothetical protein